MTTEPIDQQADDMATLANLYRLQAILDRMQKNIELINKAPNAKVINVVGGNLFDLAAQYYGDATMWTVIADANDLSDPQINGLQTLLIPPNGNNTDGILDA